MIVVVHLEQILRHGRNQGSRQEVGGEHGEDDGFRERNEEEARHAVRKNIGTNTMQMQSVETKAGMAICERRQEWRLQCPCCRLRGCD